MVIPGRKVIFISLVAAIQGNLPFGSACLFDSTRRAADDDEDDEEGVKRKKRRMEDKSTPQSAAEAGGNCCGNFGGEEADYYDEDNPHHDKVFFERNRGRDAEARQDIFSSAEGLAAQWVALELHPKAAYIDSAYHAGLGQVGGKRDVIFIALTINLRCRFNSLRVRDRGQIFS